MRKEAIGLCEWVMAPTLASRIGRAIRPNPRPADTSLIRCLPSSRQSAPSPWRLNLCVELGAGPPAPASHGTILSWRYHLRGRKPGRSPGFAVAPSCTWLPRFQRDAMRDNAWACEPTDIAVRHGLPRSFRWPPEKHQHAGFDRNRASRLRADGVVGMGRRETPPRRRSLLIAAVTIAPWCRRSGLGSGEPGCTNSSPF